MGDSKETPMSEIYDQYVDYYNSAGKNINNHISVLSEFKNIKELASERVQEITTLLESLYEDLEEILEDKIENWNGNVRSFSESNQLLIELKGKILSTIKHLIQDLKDSSKEVDTEYVEGLLQQFFKKVNQPNQLDSILFFLAFSRGVKPNYRVANNHFISLEKICNRIIENNFPSELKAYGNLSEDEKNDIKTQATKLGAPLREDVPQDKIENIIRSIFSNLKKGQVFKAKIKRKTRGYSIVHQGGNRDGQANINQIFKYFEAAHPDLINLTPRQFKKRIKKALPENMK